ncbi:MAG: hypothetical protein J6R88_01135 [Clostridia bacterium]|nr:hypothetical protein [Clostridia bacterium]
MLGLIFIILTYAVVVGVCLIFKRIKLNILSKKSKTQSTSKIYYVTNAQKSKKKLTRKKPDIAIKGSIVESIEE